MASNADEALKLARELSAQNLKKMQKGNAVRLNKYGKGERAPTFFAWSMPEVEKMDAAPKEPSAEIEEPRSSEYRENFKQWPMQEQAKIAQPQMWSPIALNKNEMDPSKWQSENQAAFEAGQTVDASPAAGFANATGIKAPTFYAWGLVTKAEAAVPAPAPAPTPAPAAVTCSCSCGPDCSCGPSCTCAPNDPAPASAPSLAAPAAACSCGCGPICTCTPGTDCGAQCTSTPAPAAKASPAPMGTYADFMNPGDWSSEYDNKFLSVASAGDSKSAGIVTAAVDKAGAFMEWGCRPPGSKTEYTSAFAPVINTAPVVIAKKSISVGAPYAEDTVSKGNWQSEYDSSYAIIKTMPEIVNELVNAVNEKVEPSVEMRAIDEDDFVFVELPSEPVDEPAVCAPTTNNIFMTSSKAKKMVYNSEYNDRFQWPAMVEACRIPSGLKDEMAITKFKSAKKGSMVTESQSKYSWPVASMSTRAASGKRTSKAMERNSNFMYHVETVSAPVATDTTSIDTLAPIAANDTDTLTTFKGDVIPAKPFIHSEPDLESAVTAATPAAPLTAHKTSNLVFQDSAAAYRLAKDTGLREDAFFKRRQTASPAKRGTGRGGGYKLMDAKFNPILMHKRFPSGSDRQIGRWTTESKSRYRSNITYR